MAAGPISHQTRAREPVIFARRVYNSTVAEILLCWGRKIKMTTWIFGARWRMGCLSTCPLSLTGCARTIPAAAAARPVFYSFTPPFLPSGRRRSVGRPAARLAVARSLGVGPGFHGPSCFGLSETPRTLGARGGPEVKPKRDTSTPLAARETRHLADLLPTTIGERSASHVAAEQGVCPRTSPPLGFLGVSNGFVRVPSPKRRVVAARRPASERCSSCPSCLLPTGVAFRDVSQLRRTL